MAQLSFVDHSPSSVQGCGKNSLVVVTGLLGDLRRNAASILPPPLLQRLKQISANETSGAIAESIETNSNDESAYTRYVALVVPEQASRHNSASRGDVISARLPSIVQKENGDEDVPTSVSIVTLLHPSQTSEGNTKAISSACLHVGCAVARALPLYSRKSTSALLKVATSFYNTTTNAYVDDAKVLSDVSAAAEGVRVAASLVDRPCSELRTSHFAEIAKEAVEKLKKDYPQQAASISCEVLEDDELEKRGFGGLVGVGKAAEKGHRSRLVILKYAPSSAKAHYCWAGKGIVYDTGGLSIKGKEAMPGMKRDMGGAAGIFGAWCASVKIAPDVAITALLCLAENAVGPRATRPDDIHLMYSGKTVEINNTDAEGRLVLADGVAYASKELKPDVLLNMCTLTGAQGISTGRHHAGLVTDSDEWELRAIASGKASGDLVHPMVYCPEFLKPNFKSVVADMKNSVKDRGDAQSSCAAQFIRNHVHPDYQGPWIHVDMAAPAHRDERGTGYGVALLVHMFAW